MHNIRLDYILSHQRHDGFFTWNKCEDELKERIRRSKHIQAIRKSLKFRNSH